MSEMNKDDPKIPSKSVGKKPERESWRKLLLHPIPWIVITFVLLQIVERAVGWIYSGSTKTLSEINEKLTAGTKDVQPWHAAALFSKCLASKSQDLHNLTGILSYLFSLLGRIVSCGLEAIALPLSGGWETAIPAFIGYGLGLYITWIIFANSRAHLNFGIGILGTIFIGGLCLVVVRSLMIMVTGLFGQLLGTVGGGSELLLSLPFPLSREFITHVIHNRAEARIEKAIKGSSTSLPAPSLTGNTTFRLKGHQGAKVVALAGTFNNWESSTTLFARVEDEWLSRIDLASGTYQYKFVVDGQWITDPSNPDTKKDGSGNVNSVLVKRSK